MVKVIISQSRWGIEGIEVVDHADDKLVCAAVSAISYTIAGAISNMMDETAVRRLKLHDGDFCIEIQPQFTDTGVGNTIMRTALIGFLQLQKTYPDQIKIQQRDLP